MQRRRRTLVLFALIPSSIAAGGMGYWWLAPKTETPQSEVPLALVLDTPTTDAAVPEQLDNVPTAPSSEDADHSLGESNELGALTTNESTPSPAESPALDARLEDDAVLAMALDASAFQSSSSVTGYETARRGSRGNGGVAGVGGTGGSSGKSSSSENPQQSRPDRTQTPNQPVTDQPVASDDDEASHEPAGETTDEPLADTRPEDHGNPCYQLWCSEPHDSDRPESDSPPDQYPPVVPEPPSRNDEFETKPPVSVPEPGSLGLLTVGLLGLLANRRRRG